jgi:hypothetical protein
MGNISDLLEQAIVTKGQKLPLSSKIVPEIILKKSVKNIPNELTFSINLI